MIDGVSRGALAVFGPIAVALVPFVTEGHPQRCHRERGRPRAGGVGPVNRRLAPSGVLVVHGTFASATSSSTPVGHQTNPMADDPAGYEFTGFVRVGAALQVPSAVATTAGVVSIRGL